MNWPTLCYVCMRPLSTNKITENPFCLFFTQESFVRISQCVLFSSLLWKQMNLLHIIKFCFTLRVSVPVITDQLIHAKIKSRALKRICTWGKCFTMGFGWWVRKQNQCNSHLFIPITTIALKPIDASSSGIIFICSYTLWRCCLPLVARWIHHLFVLDFGSRNFLLQLPNAFVYCFNALTRNAIVCTKRWRRIYPLFVLNHIVDEFSD